MPLLSATDAFHKQLKSLCIIDFPCGLGSWRQTIPDEGNDQISDYGSTQLANIEELMDLERSGPYAVDCTWSKETKILRKIAIESPESLGDPNFVMELFTTLRIVDKNVCRIDEDMLKFVNLKKLILCANVIENLDGRNFPKGLEVLELAANNVKSLSGLEGDNLSSLLHLGLAHNEVHFISPRSLTPSRWPALLSLDLSYNNLGDLRSTVEILKHLPVLRNLLLIGNPLYLSQCYHGFVIDSIQGLSFLDNSEVSADEKHHFKSLSRIKDLDVNNSVIVVQIAGINGVKKPVPVEESNSTADYPKIEFKYQVEFMFLKEHVAVEPIEKANDLEQEVSSAVVDSTPDAGDLQLISTDELPWADALEFNFTKMFRLSDLACVREFFKTGLTFSVVEVKHSYVLEDPQLTEGTNHNHQESVSDKQASKSDPKDRVKDATDRRKSATNKGGKEVKDKAKKDKRVPAELFELPRERRIVGSYHLTLETLLESEDPVKDSCPCIEGVSENEMDESEVNEDLCSGAGQQPSVKRLDTDKKRTKEGEKSLRTSLSKGKTKETVKSAVSANKGTKSGKGKEKLEEISQVEDEPPGPTPPLLIHLEIKLNRWKNTKDVLQDSRTIVS